jgi:Arc/MetJ family transcription regulator
VYDDLEGGKKMVRTNIELNDKLVDEAMKLTKKKTKKELVNFALEELVRRTKRNNIIEIEGRIQWTGNLDDTRKSRV